MNIANVTLTADDIIQFYDVITHVAMSLNEQYNFLQI